MSWKCRITQITLNMGVGEALSDRKQLDAAVADMELIAGQKPVVTLARNSIAGLRCVKAGQSVARSRFAGVACMSS